MEQDVKDRFKTIENQLEKTNLRLDGFEGRMSGAETSIQLINQNINTLLEKTSEIKKTIDHNNDELKAEIKELARKREEDHFVKPLANIDKIKFQVIGVVIGIFISAFIGFVLPNLKWGNKNDKWKIYRIS